MKNSLKLAFLVLILNTAYAQKPSSPFSLTGEMGAWYEGYDLNKSPATSVPDFFAARRPGSLPRFNFSPTFNFGKWSVPFNFNFSPKQTNFVSPSAGGKQSFWQYLTNPVNNFGIRPTIGKTEFLLGTQNLQYSDLSTGDLGVFGYGVNLAPGKFRLKFFNGVSQRPVDYLSPGSFPPNGIVGAYQRNQWMGQLGLGKEGRYFTGFNIVKSIDKRSSVNSAPLPPLNPQENLVLSFLTDVTTADGWAWRLELGQSFHTRNLNSALASGSVEDLEPLLNARTSTGKDNAAMFAIAKKGGDWKLGAKFNYIGAGYYTAGYPFLNTDRLEYLADTRFSFWKKKASMTASAGQRFGNLRHLSGPKVTAQLVGNANLFTQFNEHFSLNAGFNNYGFNAIGTTGYKSVSNEFSVNPAYTWADSTSSHLLSVTYTRSKYDETTLVPAATTHNSTQTALLLYVPTFFQSKLSPDLSLMWFRNAAPPVKLDLLTATAGLGWKAGEKINLKSQLQYSLSTIDPFTPDKNLMTTLGFDWEVYKKLTWQVSATLNLYRYGSALQGSSLSPPYSGIPAYRESTVRTGVSYKF